MKPCWRPWRKRSLRSLLLTSLGGLSTAATRSRFTTYEYRCKRARPFPTLSDEDLSGRLKKRPQSRGFPPFLVPHHLGEDLEGLLPPQCGEPAVLDLCLYGHAYEDGYTHAGGHALLYSLYALELHSLRRHHTPLLQLALELASVGATRLRSLWQQD